MTVMYTSVKSGAKPKDVLEKNAPMFHGDDTIFAFVGINEEKGINYTFNYTFKI